MFVERCNMRHMYVCSCIHIRLLVAGLMNMSISQTFYCVIDNKLSKGDKNKNVNFKCQTFIWRIVDGKCWLVYLWTNVQSDLPCESGLLPKWLLLLVCGSQRVEMQELNYCRSKNVSALRYMNWSAAGQESSAY